MSDHRLRSVLAGSLVLAFVAAGCSDGAEPATTGAARPDASAPAAPPEQFSGPLADFYRVPDPLPEGKPGTLIRVQDVGDEGGVRSVRVMYHSRDAQDHDRAVTGVITYPTAPPPDGGWPVVSWAHGTTGLSSACAPSRRGAAAPDFGVEGVRVATDYIGLGPVGERHPYLSGASEGHSVIDGVRAARNLAGAHADDRWLAIGHSQGGHSALFTNELAESYAPGLDLLGTVSVAPAAALEETFGPDDQVVPRMVGIMALYGWAADYPQIDPHDYVGPDVRAAEGVIDEGCLDEVVAAMLAIPSATFYAHDPLTTEPARSVVRENDPGQVKSPSPLLVVYGTADSYVVPDRVSYLFDQLCAIGQVTELVEIAGADHGTVVPQAGPEIEAWMDGRLAGDQAPDSCASR